MPDPIIIVESDPMWLAEFERLRTRAAGAVGDVAVAIEHIGSTAVPGLAAKPVVDLVVVVEPQDLQTAVERHDSGRYQLRGQGRMYLAPDRRQSATVVSA